MRTRGSESPSLGLPVLTLHCQERGDPSHGLVLRGPGEEPTLLWASQQLPSDVRPRGEGRFFLPKTDLTVLAHGQETQGMAFPPLGHAALDKLCEA